MQLAIHTKTHRPAALADDQKIEVAQLHETNHCFRCTLVSQ